MGKAMRSLSTEERVLVGLFLCGKKEDPLLALLRPLWNQHISRSVTEKITVLGEIANAPSDAEVLSTVEQEIFPYSDLLSKSLATSNWALSLLEQPLLFIRLRPGKEQQVIEALEAQSISFEQVGERSLALPATTSLNSWPGINRDFVIQDLSSQRIGSMLSALPASATENSWDCCAASGGKSILALDTLGPLSLTVSDKRKTILQQLHRRFAQAQITDYKTIEIDLSRPIPSSFSDTFSLIWADVPCSGSGTWSRTPEQLYFFEQPSLATFKSLQQAILRTALTKLRPEGYLLYSTCSVFAQENEEQVAWLENEMGLCCVQQQLFDGSAQQADTLYAALLQRPH